MQEVSLKGQQKQVVDFLSGGRWISQKVATEDLGITQLSSRIGELERKGIVFDRRWIRYRDKQTETKRKFMEYQIKRGEQWTN